MPKCAPLYPQDGKNFTPKRDVMISTHSKFKQLDIQISLVPEADPASKFHLKFGKFCYSSKLIVIWGLHIWRDRL